MNYRNATSDLTCDKCKQPIRQDDLYYQDSPANLCLSCKSSKITKKPGKRCFTGVSLAPIGGKRWKKQVLEALKVKSFNFTPSKNIYDVLSHQRIAGNFGTTLKPNNIEKAQLFIIELQDENKL